MSLIFSTNLQIHRIVLCRKKKQGKEGHVSNVDSSNSILRLKEALETPSITSIAYNLGVWDTPPKNCVILVHNYNLLNPGP